MKFVTLKRRCPPFDGTVKSRISSLDKELAANKLILRVSARAMCTERCHVMHYSTKGRQVARLRAVLLSNLRRRVPRVVDMDLWC